MGDDADHWQQQRSLLQAAPLESFKAKQQQRKQKARQDMGEHIWKARCKYCSLSQGLLSSSLASPDLACLISLHDEMQLKECTETCCCQVSCYETRLAWAGRATCIDWQQLTPHCSQNDLILAGTHAVHCSCLSSIGALHCNLGGEAVEGGPREDGFFSEG